MLYKFNTIEKISLVLMLNFLLYFLYMISFSLFVHEKHIDKISKPFDTIQMIIAVTFGIMWNFPNIIKIGIL